MNPFCKVFITAVLRNINLRIIYAFASSVLVLEIVQKVLND